MITALLFFTFFTPGDLALSIRDKVQAGKTHYQLFLNEVAVEQSESLAEIESSYLHGRKLLRSIPNDFWGLSLEGYQDIDGPLVLVKEGQKILFKSRSIASLLTYVWPHNRVILDPQEIWWMDKEEQLFARKLRAKLISVKEAKSKKKLFESEMNEVRDRIVISSTLICPYEVGLVVHQRNAFCNVLLLDNTPIVVASTREELVPTALALEEITYDSAKPIWWAGKLRLETDKSAWPMRFNLYWKNQIIARRSFIRPQHLVYFLRSAEKLGRLLDTANKSVGEEKYTIASDDCFDETRLFRVYFDQQLLIETSSISDATAAVFLHYSR